MSAIRPLIAALLVASAAPAFAGDPGFEFKFNDLDLNSSAGRIALEHRISSAENQLCMNATVTGSRSRGAQVQKACKTEVRRQIEAKIPAVPPDQ